MLEGMTPPVRLGAKVPQVLLKVDSSFAHPLVQSSWHGGQAHPSWRTRWRSRAKVARPYILRFMNLSLFTCPSVGP